MDIRVRGEILNLVAKNRQVIYGQQATNKLLPEHLKRETNDFDILAKKPESSAKELVENLNKRYGDKFEVVPAMHEGTFKVKNKDTGESIADYTKTNKRPKSYNEVGVRYVNLNSSERKLKKLLKDEASSFRHDKDFEMLKRIQSVRRSK